MKIEISGLTTCGVVSDGEFVELNFIDASGHPMSLRASFDDAQAIAMTLPRLLTHALQKMTGRQQVRYAFPLGSWRIENMNEQGCLITTLATEDGFEVSFGISHDACRDLGWALQHEADAPAHSDDADRAPEAGDGDIRLN